MGAIADYIRLYEDGEWCTELMEGAAVTILSLLISLVAMVWFDHGPVTQL